MKFFVTYSLSRISIQYKFCYIVTVQLVDEINQYSIMESLAVVVGIIQQRKCPGFLLGIAAPKFTQKKELLSYFFIEISRGYCGY